MPSRGFGRSREHYAALGHFPELGIANVWKVYPPVTMRGWPEDGKLCMAERTWGEGVSKSLAIHHRSIR